MDTAYVQYEWRTLHGNLLCRWMIRRQSKLKESLFFLFIVTVSLLNPWLSLFLYNGSFWRRREGKENSRRKCPNSAKYHLNVIFSFLLNNKIIFTISLCFKKDFWFYWIILHKIKRFMLKTCCRYYFFNLSYYDSKISKIFGLSIKAT